MGDFGWGSQLLSLGIWPALPVTGNWLLRWARQGGAGLLSPIPRAALATVAGLVAWSPALVVLASFGIYRGDAAGALGWVCLVGEGLRLMRGKRPLPRFSLTKDPWDYALLAVFLGAAFLYLAFPSDCFRGGQDSGIYANQGAFLAREGRLTVPYPWPEEQARLFPAGQFIPGLYPTPKAMTVQFSALFPLWLAQAYTGFGEFGLARANGLLALLFLALFHSVALRFLPRGFAWLAVLLMAVTPAQIYLARCTLTEILAQALLWGGLLTLALGMERDNRRLCALAGLLFGATALARIDGLLLVPLLIGASALLGFLEPPDPRKLGKAMDALYLGLLPTTGLAVVYYRLFSGPYFQDLVKILFTVMAATAAALILLGISRSPIRKTLGNLLCGRPLLWAWGGALALGVCWAYWIRPYAANPAVFTHPLPDPSYFGKRDYREFTLVNLAFYLSPLVVFAAAAGLVALWNRLRQSKGLLALPAFVLVAGYSAAYIWNPIINPVHYYAIRRFLPITIPGALLLALWLLLRVSNSFLSTLTSRLLRGAVVAYLCVVFALHAFPLWSYRENGGFYDQTAALARVLPEDDLILCAKGQASHVWMTPLYLTFGRTVAPLDLESAEGQQAFLACAELQQKKGRPLYLLSEHPINLAGFESNLVETAVLKLKFLQPTVTAPPQEMREQPFSVSVYKIGAVVASDCLDTNLGAQRHWRVRESGLHLTEHLGGGLQARWTDGAAKLEVPTEIPPQGLFFEMAIPGSGTDVELQFNGRRLFAGHLPGGRWTQVFDLDGLPTEKQSVIEVRSGTFSPADRGLPDPRTLGVSVMDLRLLAKREVFDGVNVGAEPHSWVSESGFYPTETMGKGRRARWTNGSAKLAVPLSGSPKYLFLELLSTGQGTMCTVLLNGREILSATLPPGGWSKKIDVSGAKGEKKAIVEIRSGTFRPSDSGSKDTRALGVVIADLRLLME